MLVHTCVVECAWNGGLLVAALFEHAPLVEFMYLSHASQELPQATRVFAVVFVWRVSSAIVNFIVRWFYTGALGRRSVTDDEFES